MHYWLLQEFMENLTLNQNDANASLRFLYRTVLGRIILKIASCRFLSKAAGVFLSSRLSKGMINGFVNKNGIDMSQFEETDYRSFNDFFTRKLRKGKRTVDTSEDALISPCDARLSVYDINEDSLFSIKNSQYSIEGLLNNSELAKEFQGGKCLIFRLCADDYHRYCYFDDGEKGNNIFIKGVLHTVQPIAFERYDVYSQNCREYTVMETKNFGRAVQVEVGALLVGKISNLHGSHRFSRGEEKGMFEFGGSTIVLLLKSGAAEINSEIVENSLKGTETIVKYGQKIGTAEKFI